jgi:hypothetical protein
MESAEKSMVSGTKSGLALKEISAPQLTLP